MFNRIIVPLDGTRFAEAALAPARELARAFGSRILVVRALEPYGLPMAAVIWDEQAELERVDSADVYLQDVVRQLRLVGYDADMLLHISAPGAGIARAAELDRADLIVMATHLRWKVDPTGSASTTLQVLARSRVPILAWRVGAAFEQAGGPDVGERPPLLGRTESPIVVPLDGSRFAESALGTAELLARKFGLYLVLVRATERGVGPAAEAEAEREATDYVEQVRRQLEDRGIHSTTVVRKGSALGVIDMAWREYDASMIVMASHGRTGFMGTFLGSVAARIIEEVEAPVLVIRPDGEQAEQYTTDVWIRESTRIEHEQISDS